MAKFIFECEDEVCLPAAYRLVDSAKSFIDKMKNVDVDENEITDKRAIFRKIVENMMVKYPADTGKMLSRLWVLEEVEMPVLDKDGEPMLDRFGNPITFKQMEKTPNAFKTMTALFTSEVAVDFFTSVLPSLLQLSKEVSPLLTSKK
jgi:hypothetical protein